MTADEPDHKKLSKLFSSSLTPAEIGIKSVPMTPVAEPACSSPLYAMMRSLQLVAASLTVVSAATVRTLYQNDLSATPAVGALIVAPASGNNITEACAAFNETPLNGIPDDVQSQIAYLRYSGQIAASVYLGLGAFFANGTSVAPGGQNFTGCPAFAVGTGYIATPNCSTITVSSQRISFTKS